MDKIKRKLLCTGLGALVSLSAYSIGNAQRRNIFNDKKINTIIIGGGLAGLIIARELGNLGIHSLILEQKNILGGELLADENLGLFYSNHTFVKSELDKYDLKYDEYSISSEGDRIYNIHKGTESLLGRMIMDVNSELVMDANVTAVINKDNYMCVHVNDAVYEAYNIIFAVPYYAMEKIKTNYKNIPNLQPINNRNIYSVGRETLLGKKTSINGTIRNAYLVTKQVLEVNVNTMKI